MTYNYNEWLKNGKLTIFCKCGCGGEIIIKPHHKYYGIPEYISGHNKSFLGKHHNEISIQKISDNHIGMLDKNHSEESKQKMKDNHADFSGENNPCFGKTGDKNSNWKGGVSFDPYCEKFNEKKKEEVRNFYGRKCYLCDKTEEQQIKEQKERGKRGYRLSVHHIDEDKGQGCNGKPWKLVPLCLHCHNSIRMVVL